MMKGARTQHVLIQLYVRLGLGRIIIYNRPKKYISIIYIRYKPCWRLGGFSTIKKKCDNLNKESIYTRHSKLDKVEQK